MRNLVSDLLSKFAKQKKMVPSPRGREALGSGSGKALLLMSARPVAVRDAPDTAYECLTLAILVY